MILEYTTKHMALNHVPRGDSKGNPTSLSFYHCDFPVQIENHDKFGLEILASDQRCSTSIYLRLVISYDSS